MDAMADESMSMNGSDMPGMTMDDADVPPSTLASDEIPLASTSEELAPANKVELPIDACTHCMSHSGIQNAPVSSVSVPDQSNKDLGSVLLPVSRFLAQPAMTSGADRTAKGACATWQQCAAIYPHQRFSDLVPSWRFSFDY